MISWFTENPTPILCIGGLVLLILAGATYVTGRGVMLAFMIPVVLVMGSSVLIDFLVVTEREQVIATIHDGAKAFEANDIGRVERCLSATAPAMLRVQATEILHLVDVQQVKITSGPEIKINRLTSPPTAVAEMIVVAQGKLRVGETIYSKIPRRIVVRLRWEGDRWLVYEAEGVSILGGETPAT
ncbi:MAG: hypothetical protein K8T25_10880 [Planctomycetia bacterium]|nr:hypothetical protein [Planctomycetia bacterium]